MITIATGPSKVGRFHLLAFGEFFLEQADIESTIAIDAELFKL